MLPTANETIWEMRKPLLTINFRTGDARLSISNPRNRWIFTRMAVIGRLNCARKNMCTLHCAIVRPQSGKHTQNPLCSHTSFSFSFFETVHKSIFDVGIISWLAATLNGTQREVPRRDRSLVFTRQVLRCDAMWCCWKCDKFCKITPVKTCNQERRFMLEEMMSCDDSMWAFLRPLWVVRLTGRKMSYHKHIWKSATIRLDWEKLIRVYEI